jgi:hypothetical protein
MEDRTLEVVWLSETPSQENSCGEFERKAKKEEAMQTQSKNQQENVWKVGALKAGIEVLREKP